MLSNGYPPTPSIVIPTPARQVDLPKSRSGLDPPSLPTPDRSSDIGKTVDFIFYDLAPDLLADGGSFRREELREICEEYGFYWPAVTKEHRRHVTAQNPISEGLGDEDVEVRPSGVIVDHKAIRAITHDLMPMCPFKNRSVATATFSLTSYEKPCGGWCCPKCGPKKTEALLATLTHRISDLSEVYWTVTTWDPGLCNRLAGRRRDRGAKTFFYRCSDGITFILSDKAIGGRKDPTWCSTMTPAEAIEWITPAMWVPGRKDSGFSDGWTAKGADADDFGSSGPDEDSDADASDDSDDAASESDELVEVAIPAYIPVTHLSDAQVIAALAKFRDEAQTRFGVDPAEGVIPLDVRSDLVKLLQHLLNARDR